MFPQNLIANLREEKKIKKNVVLYSLISKKKNSALRL